MKETITSKLRKIQGQNSMSIVTTKQFAQF